MKYLIDTNICIYFLKGKFDLVNQFDKVGFDNLYISEITIAELKYGIAKSVNPEKTKISIESFINKFKYFPI